MLHHFLAAEVKDQLVARFGPLSAGEMQHPIRVLAIQIGIGVDHLRLHPQTELHPQPMYFLN